MNRRQKFNRALKIYDRHNQANAIDLVNYVIDKFPLRIPTIQTDKGHEFHSKSIGICMIWPFIIAILSPLHSNITVRRNDHIRRIKWSSTSD